MRPLRVKRHQDEHGTDFLSDVVLDLVSDFPNGVQTQIIIHECERDGITHPLHTARCIRTLKHLGMITTMEPTTETDGRKKFIKITQKGLNYLHKWEGA